LNLIKPKKENKRSIAMTTKMTKEKGKNVWKVILILSCLFFSWTIFTISNGDTILENGIRMWAGSSFDLGNVEERALGFMNMAMIKPLWEELWFGIIGVFCALGLKHKNGFAWGLGIIWGAMMLTNKGLVPSRGASARN
jgi:hypothetical protein